MIYGSAERTLVDLKRSRTCRHIQTHTQSMRVLAYICTNSRLRNKRSPRTRINYLREESDKRESIQMIAHFVATLANISTRVTYYRVNFWQHLANAHLFPSFVVSPRNSHNFSMRAFRVLCS